MKKILISAYVIIVSTCLWGQTCVARYINEIPPEQNFFLQYPFPEILKTIGNPDTILMCHLPNANYNDCQVPVAQNLIVYKINGTWYGSTLLTYAQKKRIEYLLTDTIMISSNLELLFESVIEELNQLTIWNGDVSVDHSYIYVRYKDEIFLSLLNSFPNYINKLPELSNFVSVCLFETHTLNSIKKYWRRR